MKKISEVTLNYINQIQNCPCNVNYANESNILCATTDTYAKVLKRTSVSFVPETQSSCMLVNRNEREFIPAGLLNDNDRKVRGTMRGISCLVVLKVS